mgnify:CR=1 FL=1
MGDFLHQLLRMSPISYAISVVSFMRMSRFGLLAERYLGVSSVRRRRPLVMDAYAAGRFETKMITNGLVLFRESCGFGYGPR